MWSWNRSHGRKRKPICCWVFASKREGHCSRSDQEKKSVWDKMQFRDLDMISLWFVNLHEVLLDPQRTVMYKKSESAGRVEGKLVTSFFFFFSLSLLCCFLSSPSSGICDVCTWGGVGNETISRVHLSRSDIPREQVHHPDLSYYWLQARKGGGDTVAYQYLHLQGQLGAWDVCIWWTATIRHLSQANRDFEIHTCLRRISLFLSTRYHSEVDQSLWNNSSSTITILRLLPLK